MRDNCYFDWVKVSKRRDLFSGFAIPFLFIWACFPTGTKSPIRSAHYAKNRLAAGSAWEMCNLVPSDVDDRSYGSLPRITMTICSDRDCHQWMAIPHEILSWSNLIAPESLLKALKSLIWMKPFKLVPNFLSIAHVKSLSSFHVLKDLKLPYAPADSAKDTLDAPWTTPGWLP